MLFRLYKAPENFQQFINNNFNEFQKFILYYINDLLIFLKIKKEYTKHISMVLKRLGEMRLNINILKSKFYIQKIKFLGLIITPHKIKINPKNLNKLRIG